MFTLEQIKEAHSQVKSGVDFPRYIQTIKKLGVISYEVEVKSGHVEYVGIDNFRVTREAGYDSLHISYHPDHEQFKKDLKNHQLGNTNYLTFCQDAAKSGIEKWIMDLGNMTCTYYDSLGEQVLVESIPD